MSQDRKFLQCWEFRRVDDDRDSSSNDSKSSSDGNTLLKKHKLVPDLSFPENDETTIPLSQQQNQGNHVTAAPSELVNADDTNNCASSNKHAVKNKVKRGSVEKVNVHDPISLDDFKIFTVSVIEELNVARENMFACMREEMKKLVAIETASKPKRKKIEPVQKIVRWQNRTNFESGIKTKNDNGGSSERSMKSDRTIDSNNCFSNIQQVEQFGSFPQPSLQNLNYFDQQSTLTSNMGTGFPVQFHQGLGNGFNTPSKGPENSSGENKILGLKMSGGAIRFTGGSGELYF